MGAIQDILQNFGNETVEIIRANMSRAGQNASGETSRDLRSETTSETRLVVSGPRHVFVLEEGREPGGMPPVSKIEQWLRDKDVSIEGSIRSAAFAISKVMAEKGSTLFQEGGRSDIITPAVSDQRIDQLTEEIADASFKLTLRVIDKALPGEKTVI